MIHIYIYKVSLSLSLSLSLFVYIYIYIYILLLLLLQLDIVTELLVSVSLTCCPETTPNLLVWKLEAIHASCWPVSLEAVDFTQTQQKSAHKHMTKTQTLQTITSLEAVGFPPLSLSLCINVYIYIYKHIITILYIYIYICIT